MTTPQSKRKHLKASLSKERRPSISDDEDLIEVLVLSSEDDDTCPTLRRSGRNRTPSKKYNDAIYEICEKKPTSPSKQSTTNEATIKLSRENNENVNKNIKSEIQQRQAEAANIKEHERVQFPNLMSDLNTPKKKGVSALLVINSPKTPTCGKSSSIDNKLTETPSTKAFRKDMICVPKTPSHVRGRMKTEIAKIMEDSSDTNTDFSSDESEYEPTKDEKSSESERSHKSSCSDNEIEISSKTKKSHPVRLLPTTPASRLNRKIAKTEKCYGYIPEHEEYFKRHSSKKIHTSDHTLDQLKHSRLPADRLFALLANMKISNEHETSISNMMMDYKNYFGKWLFILNEGFSLLLYGLGSKRELLQSFHREVLSQQTVLVINGFFPSLTLKDILDSIINKVLEINQSPMNPNEALVIIENEFFNAPDMHLFIIIHNLDGPMLRNTKAQTILAALASISNIHLLASIDNINTPLLWDQTKLHQYNFSWWDCTTMLPYTDETAFENSLLVQNSDDLALSSLRSVFLSLTSNARAIYMIIVKYQLKHKSVHNYQGITFRELYANCREAFVVSSDLTLRAQLTEFLDHKLVKSKRGLDGSELLNIPIANELLQQFLDEQEN